MGPNKKHIHIVHNGKINLDPVVKLDAKKIKEKVDHFNYKCVTCKGTGTVETKINKKIVMTLCPDCNKVPNNLKIKHG